MAPLTAPLRRSILSTLSKTSKTPKTPCLLQSASLTSIIPARYFSRTTPTRTPGNSSTQTETSTATPTILSTSPVETTTLSALPPQSTGSPSTTKTPPSEPPITPLPTSLLSTLPLLSLQSSHPDRTGLYATLHIHSRPYLVTLGDRIRLPFRMPHVQPGDVLRLTHASTLGTRDYTLRGEPWVDSRLFEARAVVASVESEPMRVMEKTKRRQRKVKHVRSKHRYTEVLVSELRVREVGELAREGVVADA